MKERKSIITKEVPANILPQQMFIIKGRVIMTHLFIRMNLLKIKKSILKRKCNKKDKKLTKIWIKKTFCNLYKAKNLRKFK